MMESYLDWQSVGNLSHMIWPLISIVFNSKWQNSSVLSVEILMFAFWSSWICWCDVRNLETSSSRRRKHDVRIILLWEKYISYFSYCILMRLYVRRTFVACSLSPPLTTFITDTKSPTDNFEWKLKIAPSSNFIVTLITLVPQAYTSVHSPDKG